MEMSADLMCKKEIAAMVGVIVALTNKNDNAMTQLNAET